MRSDFWAGFMVAMLAASALAVMTAKADAPQAVDRDMVERLVHAEEAQAQALREIRTEIERAGERGR